MSKTQHAGNGKLFFNKNDSWLDTETIMSRAYVGCCVNNVTGSIVKTKLLKVHYSKGGFHAVPDYPSRADVFRSR